MIRLCPHFVQYFFHVVPLGETVYAIIHPPDEFLELEMVGESRIEDDVPVEVLLQGEQTEDIPVVSFRPSAGEVLQAAVFRIGRIHVRGELQNPSFLFRRSDTGVCVEKVERVSVCSRLFPAGDVGESV